MLEQYFTHMQSSDEGKNFKANQRIVQIIYAIPLYVHLGTYKHYVKLKKIKRYVFSFFTDEEKHRSNFKFLISTTAITVNYFLAVLFNKSCSK